MKKTERWKIAYYSSTFLLVAGVLLIGVSRNWERRPLALVAGAIVLAAALVIRYLFCRCPLCGAAMLRLRIGMQTCPSCGGSLREPQNGRDGK